MSELSEKLARNAMLPRHLSELGVLLGRSVSNTDLLSLAETRTIQERSRRVNRQLMTKVKVDE